MKITPELIQKYDVPVPRYTSYPTVPFWENNIDPATWKRKIQKAYRDFGQVEGISLYIHFPYCESLCTYCGCNKHITKNHDKEAPYIAALKKEWAKYLEFLPQKPKLAAIHLGGGTPTFFKPAHLHDLLSFIQDTSTVMPQAEFSFEGHPNNTSMQHLLTLGSLGFKRVSYGIQDVDPTVQRAIHRIQPTSKVKEATDNARMAGFKGINFDLIYGLPHQTVETITRTFEQVADFRPDRIAFYSYAHVPSAFPAQRSFEAHLPHKEAKRLLYETGKNLLKKLGYNEIGMDHFALPTDELFAAKATGTLHRNFMGYTSQPSHLLLGLGNSAISDIHYAYAQNTKDILLYQEQLELGHLATSKGHLLTAEDIKVRNTILQLICKGEALLSESVVGCTTAHQLSDMQQEGLIEMMGDRISVNPLGKPFIRNICATFDLRMRSQQSQKFVFSKAI